MPHINLLYPFIDEAMNLPEKYARRIKYTILENDIKKFKMVFDDSSFNTFEHSESINLHLRPSLKVPPASCYKEHPVNILHLKLDDEFFSGYKFEPIKEFNPHLTLGQFSRYYTSDIENIIKSWRRIEWTVDAVHLISRIDEDPFKIIATIPLLD